MPENDKRKPLEGWKVQAGPHCKSSRKSEAVTKGKSRMAAACRTGFVRRSRNAPRRPKAENDNLDSTRATLGHQSGSDNGWSDQASASDAS